MSIKFRTLILVLILLGVVFFAALNWQAFAAPTPLNVIAGTVVAPLGIVMLVILGVITLLYLLFVGKLETESLMGTRRTTRELEEARKLALSAEESRYTTLRENLDERLGILEGKMDEVLRRIDAQGRIAVRSETAVPPDRTVVREDVI